MLSHELRCLSVPVVSGVAKVLFSVLPTSSLYAIFPSPSVSVGFAASFENLAQLKVTPDYHGQEVMVGEQAGGTDEKPLIPGVW